MTPECELLKCDCAVYYQNKGMLVHGPRERVQGTLHATALSRLSAPAVLFLEDLGGLAAAAAPLAKDGCWLLRIRLTPSGSSAAKQPKGGVLVLKVRLDFHMFLYCF